MKDISHDEAMASVFKEDPEYADFFVQQLLRDGESSDIDAAIKQLGGVFSSALLKYIAKSGR